MNVPTLKVSVITLPDKDSLAMDHDSVPEDSLHQINTALTVIIGNAQLLQRRIERGDQVPPGALLSVLAYIQKMGHSAAVDVNSLRKRIEDGER